MLSVLRALRSRRLNNILGSTQFTNLQHAVWAIDRIQSGDTKHKILFPDIPDEALTSDILSNHFIHKWRLESMISKWYLTPNSKHNKRGKKFNVYSWNNLARLFNSLQDLEETEKRHDSILVEMHRALQRQLPWQDSLANKGTLFRYLKIFRIEINQEAFFQKFDFEFDDFIKIGFCYWALFLSDFKVSCDVNLLNVGISEETRLKFLEILTDTANSSQQYYKDFNTLRPRISQIPSRLRTHPIIRLKDNNLICPIPDILMYRISNGLVYDFIDRDDLKESKANSFVKYVEYLFSKVSTDFTFESEFIYKNKSSNNVRSPDLFVYYKKKLVAIIECKSTMMPFAAKFSDDPLSESVSGFDEIAKGTKQLWSYSENVTKCHIPDKYIPYNKTVRVVLTLDDWFDSLISVRDHIETLAGKLADKHDLNSNFRGRVSYVPIRQLEILCQFGDPEKILTSLSKQTEEKYKYYSVNYIYELLFKIKKRKPLFSNEEFEEIAPFWKTIHEVKAYRPI